MNRLKRLLYECTCGVVCKSLDEYVKHAEEEMTGKPTERNVLDDVATVIPGNQRD